VRTTLVITFWDGSRQPASGAPGSGPACRPPWRHSSPPLPPPAWPAAFQSPHPTQLNSKSACAQPSAQPPIQASSERGEGGVESGTGETSPAFQAVKDAAVRVAPVWVPIHVPPNVSPHDSASGGYSKRKRRKMHSAVADGATGAAYCIPLPPLRFFLRSATEVSDIYG